MNLPRRMKPEAREAFRKLQEASRRDLTEDEIAQQRESWSSGRFLPPSTVPTPPTAPAAPAPPEDQTS